MRIWGSSGVPASSPSSGSFRPEPEASQLEGAGSIDVDPTAANAGVANKAGNTIAAARGRAEAPLSESDFTTNAEKLACCVRH